jgi:hypothetical protein
MKRVLAYSVLLVVLGSPAIMGQVIYNSASTAAEGYANGMSNVIQARGQKNVNDSQARINNQDAYSKALDNSTKSVNTFWEQKDIYAGRQQQKFAEYQRKRQFYQERHGLKSFTPEEFDRASGMVNWLRVLEQPQYDQYRLVLDKLLKQRAYAGALTSEEYMQATAACKDWRAMLAKQKGTYPEQILDQMIKFVLKVNREINENLG